MKPLDHDALRLSLEMAGIIALPQCPRCTECNFQCDAEDMPRGLCPICDSNEVSEMHEDLLNERYVAEEWSWQP